MPPKPEFRRARLQAGRFAILLRGSPYVAGGVAAKASDRRVLGLIRRYLQAGVLDGGLVKATEEGTPRGGPLSPILSHILLTDLDRELERRGHRFVRYADDSNIYVKSEHAGQRVEVSITRFLATRLKLKVNEAKSAVAQPWAGQARADARPPRTTGMPILVGSPASGAERPRGNPPPPRLTASPVAS